MWKEELVEELTGATSADRKEIIKRYMDLTDYSSVHLYRIAKSNGFVSGRKKRSDKGGFSSGISMRTVDYVAGLQAETSRNKKGKIMPVARAVQIAEDNGVLDKGQLTVASMTRILRENQRSTKHLETPSAHTQMRSLHPNHVHVFDVSVCIQYYLKNGDIKIMDKTKYYKNKPENEAKLKTRLLRYVVVDHFSGAMWVKYYDTTGETADNLFDFLMEAWGDKDDSKLPFRGVPKILLMDAGSANLSKAVLKLMDRLDVEVPRGTPHNPRRQGAVETTHNIIEGWFESALRIRPATGSIEQLNEWARDFFTRFQAENLHRRHGMARTPCWLLIKKEDLRELPPVSLLKELYAKPEETRTVDGTYRISFKSNSYILKHIEALYPGAKVQVILKPYNYPSVDIVFKDKTYEVEPTNDLPALQGGFHSDAAIIGEQFSTPPETDIDKNKRALENLAYGTDRTKKTNAFEGDRVFGHHAEQVEVQYIPKHSTPMEVSQSVVVKDISVVEFLKRVRDALGRVPSGLNERIRAEFGDSISTIKAEEVIAGLSDEGFMLSDEEVDAVVFRKAQ